MIDTTVSTGKLLKISGDPLKVLESLNPSPIEGKLATTDKNEIRKPASYSSMQTRESQRRSETGILTLPKEDSLAEMMKPKAA